MEGTQWHFTSQMTDTEVAGGVKKRTGWNRADWKKEKNGVFHCPETDVGLTWETRLLSQER